MPRHGGNAGQLRRANRQSLLAALQSCDDASIAELARHTGLSVATCANIVPELVAAGAAVQRSGRESSGGRPARRYAFNPDHALTASVILRTSGRETVDWEIRNAAGQVLAARHETGGRITQERLDVLLGDLRRDHPALRAVALSIPGVVRDGVVGISDIPGLAGVPVVSRIQANHGLIVIADNDMNFAAMGYCSAHGLGETATLVFMVVPSDKCAGSGLVVNGRVVHGRSDFAGEISFIPFGAKPGIPAAAGTDRSRVAKHTARMAAAVTAMVNPDTVVMTGDALSAELVDDVRRRCLGYIPAEHMPELVYCQEYTVYSLAGMAAAALDSIYQSGF